MTNIQEFTVQCASPGEDVIGWAQGSVERIREMLATHGRVLLRGFSAHPGAAQDALSLLTDDIMEDVFWSTPRKRIIGRTFTATRYPADREIRPHSEMAYAPAYPRLLCFHAVKTAAEGGATPVADLDAVSRDIEDIVARFEKSGVRYIRTFRPGIDVPFEDAFGKATRKEALEDAKARGMDVQLRPDSSIRIVTCGRGALRDASSGALLWFNQMHLFHSASLPDRDRQNLIQMFGEGNLPRQTTFGDGEPIADEITHRVNAALEAHSDDMHWRDGDVLILDNLRYMHGRRKFSGERVLHVAMGAPTDADTRARL